MHRDERSLAPYFRNGRLIVLPRRRAARLKVLDLLAREFEPGRRYPEATVDATLRRFHPDHCALRRYLVEQELLERRDGLYWRCGGTYEVD